MYYRFEIEDCGIFTHPRSLHAEVMLTEREYAQFEHLLDNLKCPQFEGRYYFTEEGYAEFKESIHTYINGFLKLELQFNYIEAEDIGRVVYRDKWQVCVKGG